MSVGKYDDVTLAHIATHPVRYRLLKELEKKPQYIKELSDHLDGLDRKIVAFHLMTLEKYGLLTTHLETKNPKVGNPVVVRYSQITPVAKAILSKCKF